MTETRKKTAPVLRLLRRLRLGWHLLRGVLTVASVYPFIRVETRLALKRRWSEQLLGLLGITLETQGAAIPPGCLLVANHISWLDIFVINAAQPAAFVSKAEVREWPVIGWLSAKTDTIFLRRGSRGHAKLINEEIAAVLDAGRQVAVFPEGTTTDGATLLHFHAALLQPAIAAGRPVVPVALSYHTPDGKRSLAPAYAGDTTMGECVAAILAEPRLIARLTVAPALETDAQQQQNSQRRAIAEAARASIALNLGLSLSEAPALASDQQALSADSTAH